MASQHTIMSFSTDVLVIGGGFAGMWAAKKARDHVGDVLLVDKGPKDWGGLGGMSGGDFLAAQPGEDVTAMLEELVYYYDGLVEQDTMLDVLRDSTQRFRDYLNLGHQFVKDARGNYTPIPQRGLTHMRSYPSHPYGSGGHNLREELVGEMRRLEVRRVGRVYVTELLKEDDTVVGAAGFHTLSGAPCVIRAKAVVLALNMGGWKMSYHMNSCAGDAVPLALDAGLPLRNFEFIRVWNTPALFAWEGQTNMLPCGARFINSRGEDFMRRYSPVHGAKGDPHYNVRGMAHETLAGRGPIRFDTSPMREEDKLALRPKAGWGRLHDQKLLAAGIDFFTGCHEWMPQVITSYGGVLCGKRGETPVRGLFAAGRTRSLDGGVYMGGLSMCLVATTGHWAGESAGRYVEGLERAPHWDPERAEARARRAVEPLGGQGLAPKDAVRTLQEIISARDVCILKTEQGLKRAAGRVAEVKNELIPRLAADDPHYLVKLHEARGMAELTDLTIQASLFRTESRAGHYRADFPERDDKGWLCWVVARKRDGAFELTKLPVPLERYAFQPGRAYMDDFQFPRVKA